MVVPIGDLIPAILWSNIAKIQVLPHMSFLQEFPSVAVG
jgi:hypothetical protein